MNTFVIRSESTLTFGYMIDPPTDTMGSYLSQTIDTEFLASRNAMIKVSFRGATHLLDFAICEPSCGGLVSLYLIDIVTPRLTGKYPDPMLHLLSQTAWPFDLPKAALALSDALLLLVHRSDPSSFRLALLEDPDNFKMAPGIELKWNAPYKHLESTTNGLLFVLNQDDSLEVFYCNACAASHVRRNSRNLNDSSATQSFDELFASWQSIDHGLLGVSSFRVQLMQGNMSYLFVWTNSEVKILIAHSGCYHSMHHESIQWSTRFVFIEKLVLADVAAKIFDVYMHSEMVKYLRPSSKIIVASTKKGLIQADSYHFCNPNEQGAEKLLNCVSLEGNLVRLDWQSSKDPLGCPAYEAKRPPLEHLTWIAFCLADGKAGSSADGTDSSKASLLEQLQANPVFGSVQAASESEIIPCDLISSSNRCNYRKECMFDPDADKCLPFDFSANNGFLAKEIKYRFYETGRLAWELLISKNLWRSGSSDEQGDKAISSSFEMTFNSSEKIER